MTLVHTHRQDDPFVRLDKKIVMDNTLSWKAKGILAYAFSRPQGWSFYKTEMARHSSDGMSSLESGLKELRAAGYLYTKAKRNAQTNQLEGQEWHIFEQPIDKEEFERRFSNNSSETPKTGETGNRSDGKSQANKKEEETKKETTTEEPDAAQAPSSSSPSHEEKAKAPAKGPPKQKASRLKPKSGTPPHCAAPPLSSLDPLCLSDAQKRRVLAKLGSRQPSVLVNRVMAWKDRQNDSVACHTILRDWDDWEDPLDEEATVEQNRRWCKEHVPALKRQCVANGRRIIDQLKESICFSTVGGTEYTFRYSNPNMVNDIKLLCKKWKINLN